MWRHNLDSLTDLPPGKELADGVSLFYAELRHLAARYLRRERSGHTLQPTALVHEAWLQLAPLANARLKSRAQFFALAAQAMRRILVDHARRRNAIKRASPTMPLSFAADESEKSLLDVLTVDRLLTSTRIHPSRRRAGPRTQVFRWPHRFGIRRISRHLARHRTASPRFWKSLDPSRNESAMSQPVNWLVVEEIFAGALALDPAEREAYLHHACQGNQVFLREVETLLAAHNDSKDTDLSIQVTEEERRALAEALDATSLIGRTLGRFRIDSYLGEGGMGRVYRARDTRLGRDVAVKISALEFGHRFEREARAIAALNHPNVCTLHDVGPNYLVMELVDGPTLAERIAKGPIPLVESLEMCRQITGGIEAAHEKGVVHRDLKPANIKITPSGIVKVLDFGLARSLPGTAEISQDPAASQNGVITGTAAYMSPEQARGGTVDQRTDIWAFGVTMYEMLTGRPAFPGKTTREVLDRIAAAEPDLSLLPDTVRPVIERCLRKDPGRRWRSIADVRLAFELTEAAQPPARPRNFRLGWIVAGIACSTAALVLWWAGTRSRPVSTPPPMRLSVDLGPDATPGDRVTAAISPDGNLLVFPSRSPDGKHRLSLRRNDRAGSTALDGTTGAADPFFSPDSKWIGFFADGQMKKISVDGGPAVTLCEAAAPRGASWGEDGNIVVALRGRGGLFLVPDSGGAPRPLTTLAGADITHRWPQTLPGGMVLYTAHTKSAQYDEARIDIVSRKTGKTKTLVKAAYFGRYKPDGHLLYVRDGVVFSVPFDLASLELRGAPVPLLDDVASAPDTAAGQFDFSRNGTFVYLARDVPRAWPIELLDESGRMDALPAPAAEYDAPRFSPDGSRLAISANSGKGSDIYIWDFARNAMTRVTATAGANLLAVWTPDGQHLVFYFPVAGGYAIGWIRADGAGGIQRLLESRSLIVPYSFSPDGRRLAYFEQFPQTNADILTVPLDLADPDHPKAGAPETFLATAAVEAEPMFSPDGKAIAYSSGDTGIAEIYVKPFRGSGPPVKISTGGGQYPVWSRDGKSLFYETRDNRIMTTPVAHVEPHPWYKGQILARGYTNLDLSPDGKRMAVFARQQNSASVHVTFLLNF